MKLKKFLFTSKYHIVLLIFFQIVKSEYFTAISGLEKLLNTERGIVEALDTYIKKEDDRLTKLKRLNEMYSKLNEAAKEDSEQFLSNPVNAFLLVKHLTRDWITTKILVDNSESLNALNSIVLKEKHYPGLEDLNGAAVQLMRLQTMYSLDPEMIADGKIRDVPSFTKLTASDCVELGRQAYEAKIFNFTIMWMQEALNRYDREEGHSMTKADIMEAMASAAYDVGNFTLGLALTDKIAKLDPDHSRLYRHMEYYQIRLAEYKALEYIKQNANQVEDNQEETMTIRGKNYTEKELGMLYQQLCRGSTLQTPIYRSKLSCYLTSRNNSYLLLQPLKEEVMNLDPRIVVFHDIISEKETELIKKIATPKLKRATVQDGNTGQDKISSDRISMSTLLYDNEHEVFNKINKRMEEITDLSTISSEPIHVINYGIGGHYDPHFDYAQDIKCNDFFKATGNRIATWIFYLSDVLEGGSTVFPTLGVEIKPVKGSAVFWHNLFKNGEGDKSTLHAACPVLVGSKWIGNKWFHEFGNEFRRLCSLNSKE